MKEQGKYAKLIGKCFFVALTVLYGVGCAYLYYHQTLHVDGMPFESDLPYHISMAVEDHWFYSLTAMFYQVFYKTPFGNQLTAVFLAVVSMATIFATYELLREMTKKRYSEGILFTFAIVANVVMPFFVRWAHFQRYIGYQSPSVWHNSTYICMKLCAVLVMIWFWRLKDSYREGLSVRHWLAFAGLLIIANAVKPSFCMVFAPAMAFYLLGDLVCKKVPFKRVFAFGMAVIPSLLVILWQNSVLFGSDTGNGIVIAPGYTLSLRGNHPKVTFLLSMMFPIVVLLYTLSEMLKDRNYRFVWMMWGFAFLEVFFLSEEGKRSLDGNFMWGYSIALFFLFLIAIVKMLEKIGDKRGICQYFSIRVLMILISGIVLGYHTYCGVLFFLQLLEGKSYWM